MDAQVDAVKLADLEATLKRITNTVPAGGFFLEYSRERELSYSLRSARRWLEVLTLMNRRNIRGRCLDIGTSPFTFVLAGVFDEVTTLDYTDAFSPRCEAAGIRFVVGGDQWLKNDTITDDEYFDCIVFLEVIEHLHMDTQEVLRFLSRKLRPGGHLVMSTPNMMCLANRIRMLFNRKLIHFTYPAFSSNEHPAHGHKHDRVFMPQELKQYFANTNWTKFSIGYHSVGATDYAVESSRLTRCLSAPVRRLLKHLVPSLRQIVLVVAQK